MSEAIILGAIQKLESFLLEIMSIVDYDPQSRTYHEMILKETIIELRMMVDFLRDKKSEERSRLNYLLAEMAQIADTITQYNVSYSYETMVEKTISEMRMLMDFLGGREPEERSMLNNLIAGFAEAAQIEDATTKYNIAYSLEMLRVSLWWEQVSESRAWMRRIKKRMMELEACKQPESVGDEGVVVGLEKDVEQLIRRAIVFGEQFPRGSCIKGMIGVGKTTLARQVYNHPTIVGKFKRLWVNVSSNTSAKEVVVELILQLVELERDSLLVEEMDNRSLHQMLRQHLERQQRPCFVVLDNVPPEMYLDSIDQCFLRPGMFAAKFAIKSILNCEMSYLKANA